MDKEIKLTKYFGTICSNIVGIPVFLTVIAQKLHRKCDSTDCDNMEACYIWASFTVKSILLGKIKG